jgi:hypothetical protein
MPGDEKIIAFFDVYVCLQSRTHVNDSTGLDYNILAGAAASVASAAASAMSAGKKRAKWMDHARSFDPFGGKQQCPSSESQSEASPAASAEQSSKGSKKDAGKKKAKSSSA